MAVSNFTYRTAYPSPKDSRQEGQVDFQEKENTIEIKTLLLLETRSIHLVYPTFLHMYPCFIKLFSIYMKNPILAVTFTL